MVFEVFFMLLCRDSLEGIFLHLPTDWLAVGTFPFWSGFGFFLLLFPRGVVPSGVLFLILWFLNFCSFPYFFQGFHSFHLQSRLVVCLQESFVIRKFPQVVGEAYSKNFRRHSQVNFFLQGFPHCSGEVVKDSEFNEVRSDRTLVMELAEF